MRKANLPTDANPDPVRLTQEIQAAYGPKAYAVLAGDHVLLHGIADADAAGAQAVVDRHTGQVDPLVARRERVKNTRSFAELRDALVADMPEPAPVNPRSREMRPVIFTPDTEFPVPVAPDERESG